MYHTLIKAISNGKGKAPRWIPTDGCDNLREVFDFYKGGASKFKHKNVFYTINPTTNLKKKPSKNDIVHTVCIPVDIDGFSSKEDIESCEAECVETIERMGVKDYITINSGNGLHIVIATKSLPSTWIEKNKKTISSVLYLPLQSISKKYKANIDNKVLESSRILRVPYTINSKEDKEEKECYIITDKWEGIGNDEFVELVTHATDNNIIESHNISNEEIRDKFEEIGGVWRRGGGYSYLEHPIRGSKKTLALYDDAKFFWSFSDKDEKRQLFQLSDIWNMFASGIQSPFEIFNADSLENVLSDVLSKTFDIRYSTVKAQAHFLTYAVKGKDGYTTPAIMSKAMFKSQIDVLKIKEYIERLGIESKNIISYWENICNLYPNNIYDAEPIDYEKESIIAKIYKLFTARFELVATDFDDSRVKKTTLKQLLLQDNEEALNNIGVVYDKDDKVYIPYSSLLSISDKTSEIATNEREYIKMMEWTGIATENKNMVCSVNKTRLLVSPDFV